MRYVCNVQLANSWRTTGDISASWEAILRCLDNTVGLSRFAGPGAWNDPDLLEVGLTPECWVGHTITNRGCSSFPLHIMLSTISAAVRMLHQLTSSCRSVIACMLAARHVV